MGISSVLLVDDPQGWIWRRDGRSPQMIKCCGFYSAALNAGPSSEEKAVCPSTSGDCSRPSDETLNLVHSSII